MTSLRLLIVIMITGVAVMLLVTPYDYELAVWLAGRKVPWFVEVMSESIFELETIGGGDLVVFYAAFCLILYLLSSLLDADCAARPRLFRLQNLVAGRPGAADWLRRNRLRLEFMVVTAFCCSTLMVKTLKWIMARPRPKKVFWGTRPFSEWYEMGPYFLDEGTYRASFPSGHTASAISLIGLAYVLIFSFSDNRHRRSGLIVLGGVLAFVSAMAVARVMTRAHWPTDVSFSIFAGWLLIHILFFYGLRVAGAQNGQGDPGGEICPPPPFRGIRICWYLALFCLALVALAVGLKHYVHGRWPWLVIFSLASLPLLLYAGGKTLEQGLFRREG
jgi:membrane-associated phospholipid phosphatase